MLAPQFILVSNRLGARRLDPSHPPEHSGRHVLRFKTAALNNDLRGCVQRITNTIDLHGGLVLADESVRQFGSIGPDGARQLKLF